jgi:hypothetical protein
LAVLTKKDHGFSAPGRGDAIIATPLCTVKKAAEGEAALSSLTDTRPIQDPDEKGASVQPLDKADD